VDESYFDVTFVCASLRDAWWAMRKIASCGYIIHSTGALVNPAATAEPWNALLSCIRFVDSDRAKRHLLCDDLIIF
jgi:hypothetical protein